MGQIFSPASNAIARASLVGVVVIVGAVGVIAYGAMGSSYATRQGGVRSQPVEFSHEHHVGGLGIDCRYCHTFVEDSSIAGMPPTETCMQCHRQIWRESPKLAPVLESFRTGRPIRWTRVHDLPDFVYFD